MKFVALIDKDTRSFTYGSLSRESDRLKETR